MPGKRQARGVEGRGEVDGDDRVPAVHREVLHRRHVLDAGVVDEDVDATHLAFGVRDHVRDLVGLAHVGGVVADIRVEVDELGPGCVHVAEAVEHDAGAVHGHGARAMPKPMPLVEPVTSAVFPVSMETLAMGLLASIIRWELEID
jgi:hypothetical protein